MKRSLIAAVMLVLNPSALAQPNQFRAIADVHTAYFSGSGKEVESKSFTGFKIEAERIYPVSLRSLSIVALANFNSETSSMSQFLAGIGYAFYLSSPIRPIETQSKEFLVTEHSKQNLRIAGYAGVGKQIIKTVGTLKEFEAASETIEIAANLTWFYHFSPTLSIVFQPEARLSYGIGKFQITTQTYSFGAGLDLGL
jgi:hypothetical protein